MGVYRSIKWLQTPLVLFRTPHSQSLLLRALTLESLCSFLIILKYMQPNAFLYSNSHMFRKFKGVLYLQLIYGNVNLLFFLQTKDKNENGHTT